MAWRWHCAINTGVLSKARAIAAVCFVQINCCAVRTAVSCGTARGRHFTILASETSMTMAIAIVGLVHVICSSMSRTVRGCHARWRNGAVFSRPAIRCSCLGALANATICAVLVCRGSMPRTVFSCNTHRWNSTVRPSPTIVAVAQTAISLVWVLCVTVVVAINFGAWWRRLAVFASVPTITLALAAVHAVHVCGLTMTRTVEFLLACGWSAAIVTAVELTIRCLNAITFTPIGLVHILGSAMPAAIIAGIARRRHRTLLATPSFSASALAAIIPVSVFCDAMIVAVILVVARVWYGTSSTVVTTIPRLRLAFTNTAVSFIHVDGCSMGTAMRVRTARWWNTAVTACVLIRARTIAAIGLVEIISYTMSAAMLISITWRRHRTILTSVLVIALAPATIRLVHVLRVTVTTAINVFVAWRWHRAIMCRPSIHSATSIAQANATVGLVHIRCGSMTGTVCLCTTRRWDCATVARPTSSAMAHTSICAVEILGKTMRIAIFRCVAHRRNRTEIASPAVMACACAAISFVRVCCGSVEVTVLLSTWRGNITRLSSPCIWSTCIITLAFASICGIHICGFSMTAAVLIRTARGSSSTIASGPIIEALAFATICLIQVRCDPMPSAMDFRAAWWWNGAIFASIHGCWMMSRGRDDFGAHALTTIGPVRISSLAVTAAVKISVAGQGYGTIVTVVTIVAITVTTIHFVHVNGRAMSTAIRCRVTWRRNRTILSSITTEALAPATSFPVLAVTCDTMTIAMFCCQARQRRRFWSRGCGRGGWIGAVLFHLVMLLLRIGEHDALGRLRIQLLASFDLLMSL